MKIMTLAVAATLSFIIGLSDEASAATTVPPHRLTGLILSVNGNTIIVERRNGQTVTVDMSEAVARQREGILKATIPVVLRGSYLSDGTFHCVYTSHASPELANWAADQ